MVVMDESITDVREKLNGIGTEFGLENGEDGGEGSGDLFGPRSAQSQGNAYERLGAIALTRTKSAKLQMSSGRFAHRIGSIKRPGFEPMQQRGSFFGQMVHNQALDGIGGPLAFQANGNGAVGQ